MKLFKLLFIFSCTILIQCTSIAPLCATPSSTTQATEITSPFKARILNISTNDKRIINIQFDKKNLYAQSSNSDDVYSTSNGILSIPVEFSPTEVLINSFYVFENNNNGSSYLGDIEFNCTSHEFYLSEHGGNIPSYITVGRCSFGLPEATDTFAVMAKTKISNLDRQQLWNEIVAYRKDATEVFSRGHSTEDIAERCELITQFIWSLDPPVYSSTAHVNLGLMDRICGLRANKFGMLCQSFRDLFVDIASVLMPDVPIRHVDAFRWYYPNFKNIIVHSHALLEVGCGGKWWLIDPTFRFYLITTSGNPVNANGVRFLRENNRLDELTVVHIPTIKPQSNFFDDPEYAYDIFNANFWCHFKWMNYRSCQ